MPEGLSIRPLQSSDGLAWQRMFAAVADETLWIGAEPPVADNSRAIVDTFVGSSTGAMFLALVDGAAVGWISGETDDDGQIELGMGIIDGYRGQGIGSALMEAVLAWAGERTVVLRVFPHNERALALYRKFGFVERKDKAGVWPRRNGEFWDLIFMERPFPPI